MSHGTLYRITETSKTIHKYSLKVIIVLFTRLLFGQCHKLTYGAGICFLNKCNRGSLICLHCIVTITQKVCHNI